MSLLRSNNRIILSCAGSGKTTYLINEALKLKDKRVLISTFTNENLDQIREYLIENIGHIPSQLDIYSWYTFLLREGVRPYQNHITNDKRVRSIFLQTNRIPRHKKNFYLTTLNDIYSNKTSEFVVECNKASGGLVIKRLERIYDYIFIDELQDLAGYDLELLDALFESTINVVAVGDSRQATYSTNNAGKNRQFRGSNIQSWIDERNHRGVVSFEAKSDCFRSNQAICDFASELYPNLPKMRSENHEITGHDGIFFVKKSEVKEYIKTHKPMILRYNKKTNTDDYPSINFGLSKGRTYKRVLIYPTKNILRYLGTKDLSTVGDKSKFYVAVTRAKYSVAFVVED